MRAADWVVLLQIRTLATETGVLCRVQWCRKNLGKILKRCRLSLICAYTLATLPAQAYYTDTGIE